MMVRRWLIVGLGLLLAIPAAGRAAVQDVDPYQAYLCERAYDAGDVSGAHRICRPLAEAGFAHGQFIIGALYQDGRGVSRDYAEAALWFARAADQEHAGARFNLATLYRYGFGVRQNLIEAYAWYDLAATVGHVDATSARDLVARRLTPVQLAQAQQRVAELSGTLAAAPSGEPAGATYGPPPRELVVAVQQLLADLGFDPGPVDGSPSRKTGVAISNFQVREGLAVDGAVTEALRERLQSAAEPRLGAGDSVAAALDDDLFGSSAAPAPAADSRTQELVDRLHEIIGQAERERSANPRLIRQLSDLVSRYDWPWRVTVIDDDFRDGNLTVDPPWVVTAGRFRVEQNVGLRTRFRPSALSSGSSSRRDSDDAATRLFGAILGEIARQQQSSLPTTASIHTVAPVTNAFVVTVEMTSIDTVFGRGVRFGPYQGAGGASGYRLAYNPGRRPSLELLRVFPGGSAVIDVSTLDAGLEDRRWHTLEWRRAAGGEMTVRLDGAVVLTTLDRGFRGRFDGFVLVNRGGDFGFRRITVLGASN